MTTYHYLFSQGLFLNKETSPTPPKVAPLQETAPSRPSLSLSQSPSTVTLLFLLSLLLSQSPSTVTLSLSCEVAED